MKVKIISLIFLLSVFTSFLSADSEECYEAKETAESIRSDLEYYTKKLYNCVSYQSGDYYDDCYSEFKRVKSYHSDFESAVSDVGSECD